MGNSCACAGGLLAWVQPASSPVAPAKGGATGSGAAAAAETSCAGAAAGAVPPPPPATAAAGLSKNQQKKLLQRQVKLERKGQKKVLKQSKAIDSALLSLSANLPSPSPDVDLTLEGLGGRLCGAFGTGRRYRGLPLAFGPQWEEGLAVLGAVLVRPEKYDAKFLPQEYSLLHKLWAVLGGDCSGAGVLDIGAGNANCAVLAATLLGLTVICVERESPREELRAEAQVPLHLRRRVVRLEADIEDFGVEQCRQVAAAHGLRRLVLVAKHPCGVGVDRSIACAARLRAGAPAGDLAVVGCIIACCCTNKLSLDDAQVSRVAEFCNFYSQDLPAFSGAAADGADGADGRGSGLERTVEVMSRCSAWRTAAGSEGNAIRPEQLEWAELFEDAVQALRLRCLERMFGASCELRFAPTACTLQDRCLIAAAAPLPRGVFANGTADADPAFLEQLRRASGQLLAESGAIDCRPKGLKSAKYGFDYTNGFGAEEGDDDDPALRD